MAVFASGKIEAYVGPQELGGADNLEQVIASGCRYIYAHLPKLFGAGANAFLSRAGR